MDTEQVTLEFECDESASPWMVQAASLTEQLNETYTLLLQLATDDTDAEPVQMLGQPAKLTIIRGEMMRQVTGIVSEVQEGSTHPEMVTTALVVRPALEALRQRVNTKIFQSMTVPQILGEVLDEGLRPWSRAFDDRTSRAYPTCDYRVQYDESDLDFCHRLMEEEGIICWFELDGETETLVLADAPDAFGEIESLHGSAIIFSTMKGDVEGHEYVSWLEVISQTVSTQVVTRHFDWTHPSLPIEGDSSDSDPGPTIEPSGAHLDPPRQIYEQDEQPLTIGDYDGQTYAANDVEAQARLRREAVAWKARVAQGESTVIGMQTGATFELMGHPRLDLDGKYLVIGAAHHFDDSGAKYHNELEVIPHGVAWRPERFTPKPKIESIQTATVVGPSGEEIHTDEHGRVKVQFHWDRLGPGDDRSSCWLRVMQPWAGAGWGFVFIPRMGMEVMVDFVNGDPDRPMVVGSAYNGDHPPPYPLPDEKTKSTIKTNSSLGGEGFNELRFEDMAGEEEIFTHAQKDQNEVVENDHTVTVHHDETIVVDHDQSQDVGHDQTEHVGNNQELEVDANRTIAVHGDFEETIDGSETRTVTGQVNETFSASETRSVSGDVSETLSSSRTQQIGGDSSETINGSLTQTINGGATITTPASYDITAVGGFKMDTPASVTISTQGGYQVLAPGGQTSVDAGYKLMGSQFVNNFNLKLTMTTIKFEMVGLKAGAVAGIYIESAPLKVWSGVLELSNKPVEIRAAAMNLKTRAVSLKHLGFCVKA